MILYGEVRIPELIKRNKPLTSFRREILKKHKNNLLARCQPKCKIMCIEQHR